MAVVRPRQQHAPTLRLVGADEASAEALASEARDAEECRRPELARELYERALHRLDGQANAGTATTLLLAIARTAHTAGDDAAALDVLEGVLGAALAGDDPGQSAAATALRAAILWGLGDVDAAEGEHARAREWARLAGDAALAAASLRHLSALADVRSDHVQAVRLGEQCVAELRPTGRAAELAAALVALGELYRDVHRWDDGDAAFREGAGIAAVTGDLRVAVDAALGHTEFLVLRGDVAGARAQRDRALDLARRLRDPRVQGAVSRTAATVARAGGDSAHAEHLLAAAEAVARDHEDLLLAAECARERAELLHQQERHRETILALNTAYRALARLRGRSSVLEIARRTRRLESQFIDVVQRWGQSIEAKDLNTHGHCARVADLACAIAERMGVDRASLFWYRVGALLHDIGKLVIPPEVLNKPGRLTEEEWALVRSHPAAGAEMLAEVEFPWDVRPIIESHHECWDGSGYPHGIAGERIPLAARIVCVADVYDVLSSDRSFKRALSHEEALGVMRRDVGRQFDPAVFRVFEEIVDAWARAGLRETPPRGAAARSGQRTPPSPGAAFPDREMGTAAAPGDAERANPSRQRAPGRSGDVDGVTAVLTRPAFVAAVGEAVAAERAANRPVSVLLFDLDHLSRVNESYGRLQGDDVLWAVAKVLQHGLRAGDVVGRYGGDELAVLLPGAPLDVARDVAGRLHAAIGRLRSPVRGAGDASIAVTASVGVAEFPRHAAGAEGVIAAADRALFAAKEQGGDAVVALDPELAAPAAARLRLDRFVGRGEEVRRLVGWLDAACRGEPRVIAIVGEAGVGKTTLLHQLEPEVRLRAATMVTGRSASAAVKTPFAPWAEVVAALHVAGAGGDRPWPELGRLVPALGGTDPEPPGVAGRFALLEELVEFLRAAATTRPIVILLEDVQWADGASWDALEFVLGQLDRERLLVCVTIRAEEARDVTDRRKRIARYQPFQQISLRRLSRDELKRWLETVFHQGDIGSELPTFLHEYTEGNPLLVTQVLHALVEDGGIWYAGTRWEWRAPGELHLPAAWRQLITRRLARLSPRAAAILGCAAILGYLFDADLLVAAGAGTPGEVAGALDEGVAAGVLTNPDRGASDRFDFAHAIIAEAARRTVPARQLQRAHHLTARALELRAPTAVSEIARHYHAAGDDREAFRYAMLAAERAAGVHAHDEAAACLAVAQRHAPSADALASARVQAAVVAESAGRYGHAETMCDLALEHFVAAGARRDSLAVHRLRERLRGRRGQPPRRTLEACQALLHDADALEAWEDLIALLVMIAELHAALGDRDAAERAARKAVTLSAARGDRRAHAGALLCLGGSLPGDRLEETLDRYREALALFLRLADRHGQTRCWIATGQAHAAAGHLGAAREALELAVGLARESHAPDLAGIASHALGVLDFMAGRVPRAREHLGEALRLFTTVGDERRRTDAMLALAHVARDDGRSSEAHVAYVAAASRAAELGDAALELAAQGGAGLSVVEASADTADAHWRRGAELLATCPTSWVAGRELFDALGVRTALAAGHPGLAAERFAAALELAERQDPFAAAMLTAECAAPLVRGGVRAFGHVVMRMRYTAVACGYDRAAARLAEAEQEGGSSA